MDALDKKIVEVLAEDGRMALSQVAKRLEVPTATVHSRMKRLRDRGIIRGSRILLDWDKVGLPVTALVSVRLGTAGSLSKAAEDLGRIPYIQSCYAVTGEFDLLLVVRAESSTHLGELLEEIRTREASMSRTVIVLSTFFEGRTPPIQVE